MPNGLTLYESQFKSPDGSRGLVGGPHSVFTKIHKDFKGSHLSMSAFIVDLVKCYHDGFRLRSSVPLLGINEFDLPNNDCKLEKSFDNGNVTEFGSVKLSNNDKKSHQ